MTKLPSNHVNMSKLMDRLFVGKMASYEELNKLVERINITVSLSPAEIEALAKVNASLYIHFNVNSVDNTSDAAILRLYNLKLLTEACIDGRDALVLTRLGYILHCALTAGV